MSRRRAAKATEEVRRCPHCRASYVARDPDARDCGRTYCRALTTWTPEQWAGRARMAEALAAAGYELHRYIDDEGEVRWERRPVVLNDFDRTALGGGP